MGKDGNHCPQACPAQCGIDEVKCPGFEDSNGCILPDFCMPKGSECLTQCSAMLSNPSLYQDRHCHDEFNTPECNYDGGDCCVKRTEGWHDFCTVRIFCTVKLKYNPYCVSFKGM